MRKLAAILMLCGAANAQHIVPVIPTPTHSAVGVVQFWDKTQGHHVDLAGMDTISTNATFRLPSADGSTGQCLETDGAGNWAFNTCGSGGSLTPPITLSGSTTGNILTVTQTGTGVGLEVNGLAYITGAGSSHASGGLAYFLQTDGTHGAGVFAATSSGQTVAVTNGGSGAGIQTSSNSGIGLLASTTGLGIAAKFVGDASSTDGTIRLNDLGGAGTGVSNYHSATFEGIWSAGTTAAFDVLTNSSVHAFQVLQSGVTQVGGANGAFIVGDRVSGSASGQFFRASGTNRLTDSAFGDVITWDSTGVTQLKNDLIIIDSTSPHINMYAGGTLEAAWASGATAAFGVLTSASVQAFQVLQSGVTQVGGANGAFIVGDRVSGSASGQFFRASGTNRLTDSGFGDVITWDSTGVTQLKNDLIVIDTGVAPHINMYGGGTFMATLASGPTAAFDVLNQSVVHSFTVLQNGLIGLSQASPQFRLDSNGEISANLQSTVAQFRAQNVSSNNAVLLRNDGSDFYALISSTATGSWNSLRPFHFNLSSGYVNMENGLNVSGPGITATGASAGTALMQLVGTGTSNFQLIQMVDQDTARSPDQIYTELYAHSGNFIGRFVNGAYSAAQDWIEVRRNTGTYSVSSVAFPNGAVGIGGTPSGTYNLEVNGTFLTQGSNNAVFVAGRSSGGFGAFYRDGGINRLWDSSFGDVIQFTSFGTTDILGPLVVTGAVTFSSTLSGTHAQNLGTSDNVTFNSVTTGTNILINGGTLGVSGSTFAQLQMSAGGTLESTWSAGSTAALGVTNVSGSHIFTVFQSGIVDAGGYSSGSNLGVTCSGAPSGSFATYLGIVIHC